MERKKRKVQLGITVAIVLAAVTVGAIYFFSNIIEGKPTASPEQIAEMQQALQAKVGSSTWCTTSIGMYVGKAPRTNSAIITTSEFECASGLNFLELGNRISSKLPGGGRIEYFEIREDTNATFQRLPSGRTIFGMPCGSMSPPEVTDVEHVTPFDDLYIIKTHIRDQDVNVRLALVNSGCDFHFPENGAGQTLVRYSDGEVHDIFAFNATPERVRGIVGTESIFYLSQALENRAEEQRELIKKQTRK